MDLIITYLVGIGAILLFIGYVALFTWIRIKIFNDTIEDPFDLMYMPILFPIIILALVTVPAVIGQAILGG